LPAALDREGAGVADAGTESDRSQASCGLRFDLARNGA
jgi:hypothetical protein